MDKRESLSENMNKNDFMETAFPYIKTMEHRIYELSNQRDTWFLTLIGFIIATCAMLTVNAKAEPIVQILLISSIICFTIGRFLYFNLFGIQVRRLGESVDKFLKFSEIKDEDEIQQKGNKILTELKINSKDKKYNIVVNIFWNSGILLFIFGLILFMIYL